MINTEDLYALIEARRKEFGFSQAELGERAFGRKDSSGIQNLRRGSSPTLRSLQSICSVLGLDVHIGPPREIAPVEPALIDATHFAAIPRLKAQLAAGNGRENGDDAATIGHLAFSHKWLQKMGVLASQACLVTVEGDSMTPTLQSGAMVLIDERRTTIRNRRIYALTDEDGMALVKRLELIKGQMLLLHSDNPEHETRLILGNDMNRVTVLGEIVWTGHQMDQAR